MRGKPCLPDICVGNIGITPACAGKTDHDPTKVKAERDHPRVCGENESMAYWESYEEGSPPRVRGKPQEHNRACNRIGITPACAGKTGCVADEGRHGWDHPRVCGENARFSASSCWSAGSPPRVRGKHFGNGVFPWLILVLSLDPL